MTMQILQRFDRMTADYPGAKNPEPTCILVAAIEVMLSHLAGKPLT